MVKKYDVFISYRRQGGDQTAKIICDRLTDLGYKVFYDVEALRSGAFNTKLYSVIEECSDVIVVLSPNSLDRCNDENDWVRLEITHALKSGKNVIPVFLRGFTFPEILVEDIQSLRYQNGLEANSEFFDAFITRLQSFFKSRPTILQRISQNVVFKRTIPFTLSILIIWGIFLGVSTIIQSRSHTFPRTQEEKNITNEALSYIQQNITLIDGMFGEISYVYKACENYLVDSNPVQYEEAITAINKAYFSINKVDISSCALSGNLSGKIDSTPINKGDLVAVNGLNEVMCKSLKSNLIFIKQVISKESPIDISTKRKILEIYNDMLNTNKKDITYGINELLLPISSSYLSEFKQKYLPTVINLPFGNQAWLSDKKELERLTDSNYNQQQQQMNNLASIVGSENYDFMEKKTELEQYAWDLGMSQSQIDKYIAGITNKSDSIIAMKKQLDESRSMLLVLKMEAQVKFAPKEDDSPEILWGKMLRFTNLKMYDDAIKCVQMYQLKTQGDYPEVNIYVPAVVRFLKQISDTGVDYGVVVCGYEPGKPKHSVYEIGDIIISINANICLNYTNYKKLKPVDKEYKVTLLRANTNGELEFMEKTVHSDQPKIQLMDLTENE